MILKNYLSAFGILFFVNIILSVIVIIRERRKPESTMLWVMAILFLPFFGFLLYIIFGADLSKSDLYEGCEERKVFYQKSCEKSDAFLEEFKKNEKLKQYDDFVKMFAKSNHSFCTDDNELKFFFDGVKFKDDLISEFEKAEKSIYIEFYTIASGKFFDELKDVLIKKARSGVEIKIIVDGLGGRKFKKEDKQELIDAGIEFFVFFPLVPRDFHIRLNFRNHRKIVVIDSKIGYIGGFNIGDQYISLSERFGYWRDSHIKVSGSAVNDLTEIFYLDFSYVSKNPYGRYQTNIVGGKGCVPLNIVSSGPEYKLEQIRDGFDRMIMSAKKRILIQTPYFVPDEGLFKAMRAALFSGVEIIVMVPKKPDHIFVKSASRSYLGELLKYGAKVYYYEMHGFLHSKMVLIDDSVSSVGTANFDRRSFSINFETNAFIYSEEVNRELSEQFEIDMKTCENYTYEKYLNRSARYKVHESVSRLLSPLL